MDSLLERTIKLLEEPFNNLTEKEKRGIRSPKEAIRYALIYQQAEDILEWDIEDLVWVIMNNSFDSYETDEALAVELIECFENPEEIIELVLFVLRH